MKIFDHMAMIYNADRVSHTYPTFGNTRNIDEDYGSHKRTLSRMSRKSNKSTGTTTFEKSIRSSKRPSTTKVKKLVKKKLSLKPKKTGF